MRRGNSFGSRPGGPLPSGSLPVTVSAGSLRAECIAVRRQEQEAKAQKARESEGQCSPSSMRSFLASQIGNEDDRAALLQALPGLGVLFALSYLVARLLGVRPLVLFCGLAVGLALPRLWDVLCLAVTSAASLALNAAAAARATAARMLGRQEPGLPRRSKGAYTVANGGRGSHGGQDPETETYGARPRARKAPWWRRWLQKERYHVSTPVDKKDDDVAKRPSCWNRGQAMTQQWTPRVTQFSQRIGAYVPTSPLARMCLMGLIFIVVIEEEVILSSQQMTHTGPPRGHDLFKDPLQQRSLENGAAIVTPDLRGAAGAANPEAVAAAAAADLASEEALAAALAQQAVLAKRLQESQEMQHLAEAKRAADEQEASLLLTAALEEQKKQLALTTERIEAARREAEKRIADAAALAGAPGAAGASPGAIPPGGPPPPALGAVEPAAPPGSPGASGPVEPAAPPMEPPPGAAPPVTPPKAPPAAVAPAGPPPGAAVPPVARAPPAAAPKPAAPAVAGFLQADPDAEKPVPPKAKCWNGCPFGFNDKNLHIVWTSLQQRPNTRGIMGGPVMAEAKLRDLIAFSVPSMKANYNNGWRGAWLVYYDDDANANYPAGFVDRLKAAVDVLPFAAVLPAAVKGSGDGQRYLPTGGSKCMQHTKQLRKAIKDGAFATISPAPTDKSYGVSKSVTMTGLEAGDAFATKFLVDIQQKAFNWDQGVQHGKWPPAGEVWPPTGGVPDGAPMEPALVLCAFNHVYWFPNPASPDAKEGFISEQLVEKKCLGTGLTVHQRRTDTIAANLVQRHKFKPKVKFTMGLEGRYQEMAVVVKTLDDPQTIPPRSTSVEMLHAFLDNTLSHPDVEAATSWRLEHVGDLVQECKIGAEDFKACDSWDATA